MRSIQRGVFGQAVAALFGTKGRSALQLDDSVVGTYEVLRMERSPYRIPNGFSTGVVTKVAVVGNYGFVGAEAAPGTLAAIRRAVFYNDTGAAILYIFGFSRPAYTKTNQAWVNAIALDQPAIWSALRSTTYQHTVGQVDQAAQFLVAANAALVFDLPSPLIVGAPEQGRGHDIVATRTSAQNEIVKVAYWGDEYVL